MLRAEYLLGIALLTAVTPAEGQSQCHWDARRNATPAARSPQNVLFEFMVTGDLYESLYLTIKIVMNGQF